MPYSDQFLRDIYAQTTSAAVIAIIEADFDGTKYYYVDNTQSIDSNVSGSTQTYQPGRFSLELPEDTADGTPRATIDFEAADIQLVRRLRSVNSRVVINLWLVVASAPNVAEFGPAQFESVDFTISGTTVSLSLEVEPILDVQLPADRYTPQNTPGLWEGND